MTAVKLTKSSVYRCKKTGIHLKKEKKTKAKVEARPECNRIDFSFNIMNTEGRPTYVLLTIGQADFAIIFEKMAEAGGYP